jgi:hypothetical protein
MAGRQQTKKNAAAEQQPEEELRQVPTRSANVLAGSCPKSKAHTAVRVYKTDGRIRYCKCNDCGSTWKMTGPAAGEGLITDDDRELLLLFADALDDRERVLAGDKGNEVEIIQISAADADEFAETLRRIAA